MGFGWASQKNPVFEMSSWAVMILAFWKSHETISDCLGKTLLSIGFALGNPSVCPLDCPILALSDPSAGSLGCSIDVMSVFVISARVKLTCACLGPGSDLETGTLCWKVSE